MTWPGAGTKKSLAGGCPMAASNLAGLYRRGRGVAQDRAKALELYRQARRNGRKSRLLPPGRVL